MKTLLRAFGLAVGLTVSAFAGTSSPPAGNYVVNVSTIANKPAFNVSSGTISTQLKLPYITPNFLLIVSSAGIVTSTTTTPTGGDVYKASTQTFSGFNTFLGSTTFKQQVVHAVNGSSGSGQGTGGSVLINATNESGIPFQIYTSSANQSQFFGMANLIGATTSYANAYLYVNGTSSATGKADIYVLDPTPNIQLNQSNVTSPAGLYEFIVNGDTLQFRDANNSGVYKPRIGMTHPGALGFYETGDNGHFVAFQASNTISNNVTWVLPAADGSGCFSSDGSGHLSIVACSGGSSGATTLPFPNGATNYIQVTSSLQSGATFYVSSGTVNTALNLPYINTAANGNPFAIPFIQSTSGNLTGSDKLFFNTTSNKGILYLQPSGYSIPGLFPSNKIGMQISGLSNTSNTFLIMYSTGANAGIYSIQNGSGTITSCLSGGTNECGFSETGGDYVLSNSANGTFYFAPNSVKSFVLNSSSSTFFVPLTTNGNLNISSGVVLNGNAGSNGQVMTSGGNGTIPTWTTVSGSGGGASTLAATTGNVTGFSSIISSPTAIINFDQATTVGQLTGSATYFFSLNSSSVTLQANPVGGFLTASSATATYLQLSSATATYAYNNVFASSISTGILKASDWITFNAKGSSLSSVTSATTNYTAVSSDTVVLADATGGSLTVTLPTAVGITGKVYRVKRQNSGANTVTVGTTSAQTIDGSTTQILAIQYTSVDLVSDGSNWEIL